MLVTNVRTYVRISLGDLLYCGIFCYSGCLIVFFFFFGGGGGGRATYACTYNETSIKDTSEMQPPLLAGH